MDVMFSVCKSTTAIALFSYARKTQSLAQYIQKFKIVSFLFTSSCFYDYSFFVPEDKYMLFFHLYYKIYILVLHPAKMYCRGPY